LYILIFSFFIRNGKTKDFGEHCLNTERNWQCYFSEARDVEKQRVVHITQLLCSHRWCIYVSSIYL
jgi:hypothetical protein